MMKDSSSSSTRTLLAFSLFVFTTVALKAQSVRSYIYGTVYTKSDESYEGFMRWGKEELFWHDVFNSTKISDSKAQYTKKKSSSRWLDFDWDFSSLWDNKYSNNSRRFTCHFGDIKSLEMGRGERIHVELKNGSIIDVKGGSNDVSATIRMQSPDLGKIKLPWDRIERIEFSAAPIQYKSPYDDVLYGTVHTSRNRKYQGVIAWDKDERIGSDILDGESREGDHEIPFGLIRSIKRLGDEASTIVTKTGKELHLDNSNDVDDGNRGIIIFDANYNTITVDWDDFHEVFFEPLADIIPTYDDFKTPRGIQADILTFRGDTYSGMIAFDVDEMWELEFLDGKDDDIEYEIPFRNISRIVPKNSSYSMIVLKDGESMLLGDTQDVSDRNDGILIFTSDSKDPVRVRWDDIDEIIIK